MEHEFHNNNCFGGKCPLKHVEIYRFVFKSWNYPKIRNAASAEFDNIPLAVNENFSKWCGKQEDGLLNITRLFHWIYKYIKKHGGVDSAPPVPVPAVTTSTGVVSKRIRLI